MKKIYLNDYFMTDFIFDELSLGDEWEIIKLSEIVKEKRIPFIFKLIKARLFPLVYIILFYLARRFNFKKSNNFKYVNSVLYFSVENMYELSWLLYHNRMVERHALWIWNPISSLGRNKLDRLLHLHLFIPLLKFVGVELWSFDKKDVMNHGFNYHPQVHNSNSLLNALKKCNPKSSSSNSFLFVGLDKGRLPKLIKLKEMLSFLNVKCELHITANVGEKYSQEELKLIKYDYLPYGDYINKVSSSVGLIDFVQSGQTGLTLRVLEAIFLKKKLVTNNESIVNYDFFNASNIFVISEYIDADKLNSFLKAEFVDIEPSILKKYELKQLLQSIFN